MGMFLFLIGILLFVVGTIMLIINFFKKKPKKNLVILMLVGVIFFIVGTIIAPNYNTNNDTSTQATSDNVEQKSEEEQYFDTVVSKLTRIDSSNYNSKSYSYINYRSLLRNPEQNFDYKIYVAGLDIFQVIEVGKYTQMLGMFNNSYNDVYMLLIETDRLESKILKNDKMSVVGQSALTYKYTTQNNQTNEVPLIYINAYELKE